jgi:hypothetical protein
VKAQQNYIKRIKKLAIKPGEIVVVTLKGHPSRQQLANISYEIGKLPFMRDVEMLVMTDNIDIGTSAMHDGKHQVLLDNLEYLEYLAKHKGDAQ